jgi:alkaline phosphatase D
VWGNSLGTLDSHVDPQNLPTGLSAAWSGQAYACFGGGGDDATASAPRGEIYNVVRVEGITGFVTVSGDRHAFWAGLSVKSLPPLPFDPVGAAFITGSVSAPGIVEAYEHRFPKDHPLRALYVADVAGQQKAAVNLLLHHGVRPCLEYQRTGDAAAARRLSNPDLTPHLAFLGVMDREWINPIVESCRVSSWRCSIAEPRGADFQTERRLFLTERPGR